MNTCSICLQTLQKSTVDTSSTIGASIPCGHCFHFDCFTCWKVSRGSNDTKCPVCNIKSKDFCRIYIDVDNCNSSDDGDDDDLESVSSSESDICQIDDDDDDDADDDAGLPNDIPKRADSSLVVGVVVDLTSENLNSTPLNSPGQIENVSQQVSQCVDKRDKKHKGLDKKHNSEQLIRKKAKGLKRRLAMERSKCKQLGDDYGLLSLAHKKTRDDFTEMSTSLQRETSARMALERDNEALRLLNVRLRNELNGACENVETVNKELKSLEFKLHHMEENSKREVEKARGSGMAEIKSILKENRKLVHENQNLKLQLSRRETKIKELMSFVGPTVNCTTKNSYQIEKRSASEDVSSISSRKSAKTLLRSLDTNCYNQPPPNKHQRKRKTERGFMGTVLSSGLGKSVPEENVKKLSNDFSLAEKYDSMLSGTCGKDNSTSELVSITEVVSVNKPKSATERIDGHDTETNDDLICHLTKMLLQSSDIYSEQEGICFVAAERAVNLNPNEGNPRMLLDAAYAFCLTEIVSSHRMTWQHRTTDRMDGLK